MKISLVGLGMGTTDTLTLGAWEALQSAEAIIGAGRLLDVLPDSIRGQRINMFQPRDILQWLEEHSHMERVCVAYSGDIGFFSGAAQLFPCLEQAGYSNVEGYNGISTAPYLCMRCGIPWQDVHLVTAHGVECDVLAHVLNYETSFFLTGGKVTPGTICAALTEAGLGDTQVTVGERLSYPDERVITGEAARLTGESFVPLSAVLVQRKRPVFNWPGRTCGIPDSEFTRDKVPMTKQEVRAAIMAKLELRETDVVWDIGAGTGSVAVEAALAARWGRVYALEENPVACELIRENRRRFGVYNLICVEGSAPAACGWLPTPDAVFVGGSKGQMLGVLQEALRRNPAARVVISAVTLETLSAGIAAMEALNLVVETAQVSVTRTQPAGDYHMLRAMNPIFVISGRGSSV